MLVHQRVTIYNLYVYVTSFVAVLALFAGTCRCICFSWYWYSKAGSTWSSNATCFLGWGAMPGTKIMSDPRVSDFCYVIFAARIARSKSKLLDLLEKQPQNLGLSSKIHWRRALTSCHSCHSCLPYHCCWIFVRYIDKGLLVAKLHGARRHGQARWLDPLWWFRRTCRSRDMWSALLITM